MAMGLRSMLEHGAALPMRPGIERAMYCVVDTVPKRSSTALYSPIRARDQKCLLGVSAREETACSTCEPPVTGKSVGRVYRLIDLVSSSSIDDTLSVFAESVFLERSFFSAVPPIVNTCRVPSIDRNS